MDNTSFLLNNGYNSGLPTVLSYLLAEDIVSGDYFSSLPEEVQDDINAHADEIRTAEDLHYYAERQKKRM